MKRPSLPLLLWLMASAPGAGAQTLPPPPALVSFANLVMTSTASRAEIRAASRAASSEISALNDEASRLVHDAERLFLQSIAQRGFAPQDRTSTRDAETLLEEASSLARRANRLRPTSEGYRVLADCMNQLLDLRGLAYKMFNLGAAKDTALRAVALNEKNPLAQLSAAAFLMNVPVAVGGDPDQAREHLKRAREATDGSDFVNFLIAFWTLSYELEHGSAERAEENRRAAAAIFPQNWLLLEAAGT